MYKYKYIHLFVLLKTLIAYKLDVQNGQGSILELHN